MLYKLINVQYVLVHYRGKTIRAIKPLQRRLGLFDTNSRGFFWDNNPAEALRLEVTPGTYFSHAWETTQPSFVWPWQLRTGDIIGNTIHRRRNFWRKSNASSRLAWKSPSWATCLAAPLMITRDKVMQRIEFPYSVHIPQKITPPQHVLLAWNRLSHLADIRFSLIVQITAVIPEVS